MIAVDTNIIVRYLTEDHPEQARIARELIGREEVFVSLTVLLEAGWMLRSTYGFAAVAIAKALREFAGLPHVTLEDPSRVALALDWTELGADFADALHRAAAVECEAIVTFDRAFERKARGITGTEVRILGKRRSEL